MHMLNESGGSCPHDTPELQISIEGHRWTAHARGAWQAEVEKPASGTQSSASNPGGGPPPSIASPRYMGPMRTSDLIARRSFIAS
jgi:hypothetical protein